MEGVNFDKTVETIMNFNKSCKSNRKFDPTILDGRKTVGLEVPKSNWALTDTPHIEPIQLLEGSLLHMEV